MVDNPFRTMSTFGLADIWEAFSQNETMLALINHKTDIYQEDDYMFPHYPINF